MSNSNNVGTKLILGCQEDYKQSSLDTVCHTTKELMDLAWEAMTSAKLAGFQNERSHFDFCTMHKAGGFMVNDELGNWECTETSTLCEA